MSGLQGSARSTLLEYIQRLKQLDANKPQASILDPDVSGGSLAPPDRPSPMGGLAGRIAALAGMHPESGAIGAAVRRAARASACRSAIESKRNPGRLERIAPVILAS
jgi:hypothetical protein